MGAKPPAVRRFLPRRRRFECTTLLTLVALATGPSPTTAGPGFAPRTPAVEPARQAGPQGAAAFDARVELVTLSVSVLDHYGSPVADLGADDFVIFEDGRRYEAALVLQPGTTPLDIALLVDLSVSMRESEWRDRSSEFLDSLAPSDCAFLLGFSTDVGGAAWGRPHDEILHEALAEADTVGGTALFDALLVGLRELESADSGATLRGSTRAALNPDVRGAESMRVRANNPCPTATPPGRENDLDYVRRKAVVVVSDGADSTSDSTADEVLTTAELAGIPIFPIQLEASDRSSRGAGGLAMLGPGGRRAGGRSSLPDWARDGLLQGLADATGGSMVQASGTGYEEILAWLRGSYLVGYYSSAAREYGTGVDFTRHEVSVELSRDDVDLVYQPAYFRPTIDTQLARREVDEAGDLIADGELDAALLILDRAIRADPGYAPAYFNRAIVHADSGRLTTAQADALRAASLSPGVADMHELAMLISVDVGDADSAWEQAIQAAQAGADLRRNLGRLEAVGPAPADFDARLAAPRIMVARPYTEVTNLLMDTALAKVFQTVRQELASTPRLAVVVNPAAAGFIMTVRGDRLSNQRPRWLEGQLVVTDISGQEVYKKAFRLNDVDSPTRIAEDLARFVGDLEDKLER